LSRYDITVKKLAKVLDSALQGFADVYNALICPRVYKPAMPYEEAAKIIIEGRGTHFGPVIVDAFMQIQEQFIEISQKYR